MKLLIKYILIFLLGIIIGYTVKKDRIVLKYETNSKDSIFRDSIILINDSIVKELVYIEREYDKEISTIMSNDDSINMELFTRYLENYKRSIENNQSHIFGTSEIFKTDSVVKPTN